MGVTTERRRKYSPTYLQGITMPERPHTLEEYATDHFRSRYERQLQQQTLSSQVKFSYASDNFRSRYVETSYSLL
jgi:hypothetical protein